MLFIMKPGVLVSVMQHKTAEHRLPDLFCQL